jgi:hypothetical protein
MELKAISRCFRFCAVACLVVLGLAASEHHGLVKFGTVPVPGATVTATKGDKKVVAITDDTGAYTFPDLEDGTWTIKVEMLTFAPLSKEIGVIANAPPAEWDLKMLSMDDIKPSMQAAPPPPPAGTAPTATPGTPAPTTPAPTAAAAPPAKGKGGKNAATTAPPQPGFQRTDVNASADSASLSNAAPSIASQDPASTSSDAMVVNGSTSNGIERRTIGNGRKGPRSLFNGGIDFRNFSDYLLNAQNYSLTGQDLNRPSSNSYNLGGSLSGPLWVPHLFRWSGNFFVTFSHGGNRTANVNPTVMPTEAEREGDFSSVLSKAGTPITVLDPITGSPFPNGLIPAGRISPQAAYLLKFFPLPQFTAANQTYNFEVPTIGRGSSNQLQIRATKNLPTKNHDTLNMSFVWADNHSSSDSIFNFLDRTATTSYVGDLVYNHSFTRSLRGTGEVKYSRTAPRTIPYFANVTNVSGQAGIAGNDQSPADWGPPTIGFSGGSGIASLSDANPSFLRNQSTQFSGKVIYYRRPHTFTIGGDFYLLDSSIYSQSNGRGSFSFTGTSTGYDFASFLLGVPDASNIAFGNADKYLSVHRYDAYIDDDWRLTSSFSVRWGLRWDYGSPVNEKYNRLVNLDVSPGFTNSTPVLASSPVGGLTGMHYPSSLINADKLTLDPNASFAWKPIFGGSMVVRGGYGLAYNTSIYNAIASRMDQQYPFSKSQTLANSASNPLTLANGFPAPTGVTQDTFGVDPNFKIGYAQNWTLSVQQNITASVVATATYSGIKGTHQPQEFQPNTYPVGSTVVPCPTCLSGYTYLTSYGNSTRNAGNLNVRRRFHGGLMTTFNYTYAKAIDDSGGLGTSTAPVAQNWLNLAGERSLSNGDQRHLFSANFQYSTGVGVRGGALLGGWRGLILKGWTMSSTITVGSGMPFTPIYAGVTQGTGLTGTIRPEYLGGDVYDSGVPGRFLNPAAFGAPPAGQWGDVGRNSLIGPSTFSMIGSAARSFADNITVTVNATNILNHPVVTSYYNTISPTLVSNFGEINNIGSMRTIQATLRWTFQ